MTQCIPMTRPTRKSVLSLESIVATLALFNASACEGKPPPKPESELQAAALAKPTTEGATKPAEKNQVNAMAKPASAVQEAAAIAAKEVPGQKNAGNGAKGAGQRGAGAPGKCGEGKCGEGKCG